MTDKAVEAGLMPSNTAQDAQNASLAEQLARQFAQTSDDAGNEMMDAQSSRKSVADTIAAIRLEFGNEKDRNSRSG